jgi:hypothetical protein
MHAVAACSRAAGACAQRSSAQFGVLYVMIYILGYMAKARCRFLSNGHEKPIL